jgi:predicted acylesterase/phospholipase RssA
MCDCARNVDAMEFSGGGLDIYRILGAVAAFQKIDPKVFDGVTHLSGASAGSVLASMMAICDKDMVAVVKYFLQLKFDFLSEAGIPNKAKIATIFYRFGMHEKKAILPTLIDPILEKRLGNKEATLKDVFVRTKLHLCLRAVDLVSGKVVHLNHETFPNMPLRIAIWGSCAVPGVTEPAIFDGMHLIDGGVLSNVNIKCFEEYSTAPQKPLAVLLRRSWKDFMGPHNVRVSKNTKGATAPHEILATHVAIGLSVLGITVYHSQLRAMETLNSQNSFQIRVEGYSSLIDAKNIEKRKHQMLAQGANSVNIVHAIETLVRLVLIVNSLKNDDDDGDDQGMKAS